MLTVDLVSQALPPNLRGAANQSLVDRINNAVSDPVMAEQIRDNFVSYAGVLKDGRFKTEDYLHAVMYVSHKLMGATNKDAYARTFPQRYADLVAAGTLSKDIAAYVTAYNKGKLVNLILEQTLVPTWVLNQHIYQAAINTQYELMTQSESDKVRTEAANSLLTHLKKPEALKAEISLDVKDSSGMTEMKAAMVALAQQQQKLIEMGAPTRAIAAMRIVDADEDVIDGTAVVLTP